MGVRACVLVALYVTCRGYRFDSIEFKMFRSTVVYVWCGVVLCVI